MASIPVSLTGFFRVTQLKTTGEEHLAVRLAAASGNGTFRSSSELLAVPPTVASW
jgi:hypothetical protein